MSTVTEAAKWLAMLPPNKRPRPIVAHLHKEFGLSAADAIEAIREANLIRARAT